MTRTPSIQILKAAPASAGLLAPVLAALFGLFLVSAAAEAMSVTPIQVEMKSAGGPRAQVTVTNDAKEPLPVEITIEKLSLSESGDRKTSKAGDDFLVFPPQAMIPPGGSQVFRLQWVGEPEIAKSETFLMSVNQVPVKLPKGKSAVQIVMSFGVIVNVAPPKGAPALKVVGTGVTSDKKSGKRHPTVTLENASNVHALLPEGSLQVAGGGWSHTFSSRELSEKVGIGLVQPGKKRKFTLPVDLPANVSSVQASLDYRPKR